MSGERLDHATNLEEVFLSARFRQGDASERTSSDSVATPAATLSRVRVLSRLQLHPARSKGCRRCRNECRRGASDHAWTDRHHGKIARHAVLSQRSWPLTGWVTAFAPTRPSTSGGPVRDSGSFGRQHSARARRQQQIRPSSLHPAPWPLVTPRQLQVGQALETQHSWPPWYPMPPPQVRPVRPLQRHQRPTI